MASTKLKLIGIAVAVILLAGALRLLLRARGDRPGEVPAPTTASASPDAAPKVVYDPTRLIESGVPAGEVFLKEPRDETWAGVVETVIGGKMRDDLARLVPGSSLQMTCKTLTCLIGVVAPAEKRAAALALVKIVMLGPFLIDFDPKEDGTQRVMFATEPRMSDPQVFVDWYRQVRKTDVADDQGRLPREPDADPRAGAARGLTLARLESRCHASIAMWTFSRLR